MLNLGSSADHLCLHLFASDLLKGVYDQRKYLFDSRAMIR